LKIKLAKISVEDKKVYGEELLFDDKQPTPEKRASEVSKRVNWYNYTQDKKTARKWIVEWLEQQDKKSLVSEFSKIKDTWVPQTCGWYSRLAIIGLELTEGESKFIIERTEEAIQNHKKTATPEDLKEKPKRLNIQEIMIEKTHKAGGEIDGIWDDYVQGSMKASEKPQGIQQILANYNIMAQHVSILKNHWTKEQAEFSEAVAGTDADLSEAYSCYTKTQLKNMINYCATIISELEAYHQSKKAKQGVRKKKPVPPEKQVRKLKHLRRYDEFKLETVEPTKILKSNEMYVYNIKNCKLQYYVADEYAKFFIVKGTSILGFDVNKSSQKTLRKPQEVLKALRTSGKPDSRKLFDGIKTTATAVNGRFNENLIIIKAT